MGNSFFHFKQFSITFQEKGLKVGTDACLLGALSINDTVLTCLDIGTGSGVIAMMLAQRFPMAKVDAIEIEESVALQASRNIGSSVFNDRIRLITGDFLKMDVKNTYDLITCNPPYFTMHLEKEDSEKNRAIHNKSLDPDLLLSHVKAFMNNNSKFYVIYPPYEASNFIRKAKVLGLNCAGMTEIYNRPGKHFRTLMCFTLSEHDYKVSGLLLYNENKERSIEFNRLMHDFYLDSTEIYKSERK